jgi:hypothetical protein
MDTEPKAEERPRTSRPPAPPDVADVLVGLERSYWEAMKRKDADIAVLLTDDPVMLAGPDGASCVDHEALRRRWSAATWRLHDFVLSRPQVQLLTRDVALVTYRIREILTVDGERVSVDATDASTWVRRDGRWVCGLHVEAVHGDPFGRDHGMRSVWRDWWRQAVRALHPES